MRQTFLLCLAALGGATPLLAQPFVTQRGIVSAASLAPWGSPGGAIARGSVFSIYGTGLGPTTSPPLTSFPLSTTLGGVSIKVSSPDGSTSVAAIPLFVSPAQINAVMPSNTPLGMVSLVVTYNGQKGNPSPVKVSNSSFGTYAASGAGFGPGILQNFNSSLDQPINSLTVSAQPGQVITLWGTGLGPVGFPDNVAPTAGNLPTPVEVFVGGKSAPLLYSGRSPCCAGTDQIAFSVPNDAPMGCWVPVQIRTEGSTVSNTVTMAIAPTANSACSEPGNPIAAKFATGARLGWIDLYRIAERWKRAQYTVDTTLDSVSATYRKETGGQFAYNPLYSLPPVGSCTTYAGQGNFFASDPVPGSQYATTGMDAGAQITVGPQRVAQPKSLTAPSSPLAFFQTGLIKWPSSNLALNPGTLSVQDSGGADVGPFNMSVAIPSPLTWTNRDQIPPAIDRTQPLTVTFSGVPSGHTVIVMGGFYSTSINATGLFTCTAPGTATSFTIPSYILASIPTVGLRDRTPAMGLLIVGSAPLSNPLTFSASGLDYGAVLLTVLSAKTAVYR